MNETFYFGAGPAALPYSVLQEIKQELVDYRGTGLSVLELSHRSDEFLKIRDAAENLLRKLMRIPDDYAVLFLHGGATAQYSMLPKNFLRQSDCANYICTGHWSRKACQEAKRFADINEIQALVETETISVTPIEQLELNSKAKYIHYCDNETINGVVNDVANSEHANIKHVPLFCDMTSSILTRPIQINKFGLIYASAQKNLGIAGLCVMIINKTLLDSVCENIPSVFDYKRCFDNKSLVNTAPTFAIYVLSLMLEWIKTEGGVDEANQRRRMQASALYDVIDSSELYTNNVARKNRSNINIPFSIENESLQIRFLQQAASKKLLGLQGHRSVGGIRASLYNAMSQHGVNALLDFMQDFDAVNS